MSFVSSSGVIRPSQPSSVRKSFPRPTVNYTPAPSSFCASPSFCVVNIPLDSLQGIESSNTVPFVCVLGSGVERCSYEKGKLVLSCSVSFNNAYISYGILDLQEGGIGSVIASMNKEGDSFSHRLYDNAVMVCSIHLS
ncbi:Hypothetical protein BRZCDTV_94 [Brazilian cedratvirus IHUMI]|uniref:Uncharacterized protein n=1 Tax=Brazilian cedratvirus IHUMI TaxID=2126980 RepID=A0A2R8FDA4_9VIRU|nr:Hypothetical protein BRZCDTV_94 [Brazilian cedratvirus IHUMI]